MAIKRSFLLVWILAASHCELFSQTLAGKQYQLTNILSFQDGCSSDSSIATNYILGSEETINFLSDSTVLYIRSRQALRSPGNWITMTERDTVHYLVSKDTFFIINLPEWRYDPHYDSLKRIWKTRRSIEAVNSHEFQILNSHESILVLLVKGWGIYLYRNSALSEPEFNQKYFSDIKEYCRKYR